MDVTQQFETHRSQLRATAYRLLGSVAEADDAVQEAWLRLRRADVSEVVDLASWLRTVVSRLCLDMLRTRASRREEPLLDTDRVDPADPAAEAELVAEVGRAMLVVLSRLGPAERVAFVLHDLFAVPFDEIAPIVSRTPVATKKLASRARIRVHGAAPRRRSHPNGRWCRRSWRRPGTVTWRAWWQCWLRTWSAGPIPPRCRPVDLPWPGVSRRSRGTCWCSAGGLGSPTWWW
ncbi:hypothetical protein GCM10029964_046460 [Kibdelosporangium lantanae]